MTLFSGYGISPYGTGIYGLPASMSLQFAIASSIRRVEVHLSSPPQAKGKTVSGDALNPNSWSVRRLDTMQSFFILKVERLSSTIFELYLMKTLGEYPVEHEVTAELLFSVGGSSVSTPVSAQFYGVAWPLVITPELQIVQDLKYNQPGVFEVESNGDYLEISGLEVLKKIILRKLTTIPASFFHLPNFGIGLRVKEPIPGNEIVKLKRDIELAVLEEPEVAQVGVQISFSNDGILIVKLAVQTRDNQGFDVSATHQTGYYLSF